MKKNKIVLLTVGVLALLMVGSVSGAVLQEKVQWLKWLGVDYLVANEANIGTLGIEDDAYIHGDLRVDGTPHFENLDCDWGTICNNDGNFYCCGGAS